MFRIARFYNNPLLFGSDATPRLVALEMNPDHTLTLFHRDPAKPGQPGTLHTETAKLEPFCWLTEPSLMEGFQPPHRVESLEGDAGYRTLVHLDSWAAVRPLLKHLKQRTGKTPGASDSPYLFINDPVTQYLIASGKTHFKGMGQHELHRLQLDIETWSGPDYEFPNAERAADRIIAISLSDNFGWEQVIRGDQLDEQAMLETLNVLIAARDPDVIEGHNLFRFDLPYIQARAKRWKVPLRLGRQGGLLCVRPSRFNAGERTIDYPKYTLYGRHIVDTMHLAQLYDASARDLESFGLKDIARHFHLAAEDRTYVPGSEIARVFDTDPERLMAYALDDVRETRAIAALLGDSTFIQAQIFPLSYQDVVVKGNASRIDLLFLRAYQHARQAIPQCPTGRPYAGGFADMLRQGVIQRPLHCDIRSLYPSVMVSFGHGPASDSLQVFPALLKDLRTFRLEAKKAARDAPEAHQRQQAQALQSAFKVLINSFYGYLGFSRGHFADFDAASAVTEKGRALLKQMVGWLEARGATIIEIDTDGIYFTAPPEVEGKAAAESLIEQLNASLPEGIDAELDGRYKAMFSYKVKNYVLMTEDGKLRIKGSGLRSRAMEKFQRRLMETLFRSLLEDRAEALGEVYLEYHERLRNHSWDPSMFCKRETLRESLSTYREKRSQKKRSAAAAYELAIASGRPFQPGDPISYYVTGSQSRVKVYEVAKMVREWDPNHPDENVPYYLGKLEELYKKFEPFIVDAGGPGLKELSGQLKLLKH